MAVRYALNVSVLDATIFRRHEKMCEVVCVFVHVLDFPKSLSFFGLKN